MDQLLISTTVGIAALAAYLIFLTILKYAAQSAFIRMRWGMTGFLVFIVTTLTAAFSAYTVPSLAYSMPALVVGMLVGYIAGVRAAQERLMMQGVEHYMEHFAHVHLGDVAKLRWWSVINFYSIAGALVIINLLGLSIVIFQSRGWALFTCAVGAFLVGTLLPYLIHLWTISAER